MEISANTMKNRIIAMNRRYSERVDRLLDEMSGYPAERLNKKPADGGWSAIQTAYHLLMAEEGSMKYLRKKLSSPGQFERAGWPAKWRGFLLWLSLSLPFKFKAPPTTVPENLPEKAEMSELRGRWQQTRADWTHFFEQLPDELFDKAVYRHPRAGRLGWVQTLQFLDTHLVRHRKQILRALA